MERKKKLPGGKQYSKERKITRRSKERKQSLIGKNKDKGRQTKRKGKKNKNKNKNKENKDKVGKIKRKGNLEEETLVKDVKSQEMQLLVP